MESRTGFFRKPFFYIIFSVFILWILLFEFVIPENNFIPRPGIVLITIPSLFIDYNFLIHLITTLSVIYFPSVIAYLILYTIRGFVLGDSGILKLKINFLTQLSVFVPAILPGILLIYWFPHFFFIEYIFSFIVSSLWWILEIRSAGKKRNENYVSAFKSLGAGKNFINKNILWNEIKPEVFGNIFRFHLQLWSLILIFEFISNTYGLGSVLKQTLMYHDLSALTVTIFVISILIWLGYLLLKFIENKFIFWNAE